ncbi:hypothetical protein CFP56_029002 [Quercus suber]|uniref:Uncharacterized protein n=1 Tax=Quercus suber TaxID=58331 RepID=A0AAW0JTI1_QUESU
MKDKNLTLKYTSREAEDYNLDHVPRMPTRYSYDDLQHRKKIILDIARGITYLPEDSRLKIVHLEIIKIPKHSFR